MEGLLMIQPLDVERLHRGKDARPARAQAGRRRPVRCLLAERDVEVEFETRGFLMFRWPVAVRSCTAFDPPTEVTCRRRCVDATFRNAWKPGLPVTIE